MKLIIEQEGGSQKCFHMTFNGEEVTSLTQFFIILLHHNPAVKADGCILTHPTKLPLTLPERDLSSMVRDDIVSYLTGAIKLISEWLMRAPEVVRTEIDLPDVPIGLSTGYSSETRMKKLEDLPFKTNVKSSFRGKDMVTVGDLLDLIREDKENLKRLRGIAAVGRKSIVTVLEGLGIRTLYADPWLIIP